MRVVFMGTPQLAADILDEVARHHDVACVYTQPDKVRGRGKKLVASPVKVLAEELGLNVRCPISLKSDEEVSYLASLSPDVICVAAYGMILPKAVLDMPAHGCLNVHASILPRWRGAAPIERAIMSGDEYAGVCIMRMEEGLDTGDWCICRKIPIEGMRASNLTERLAELGAQALLSALEQVSSDGIKWNPQDDSQATYAPKLEKRELWLDPDGSSIGEYRKFLASTANHPSKVSLNGKTVTLLDARLTSADDAMNEDGTLPSKGDLLVRGKQLFMGFDDGAIEILALKPDGKGELSASFYLAGAHLPELSKWAMA